MAIVILLIVVNRELIQMNTPTHTHHTYIQNYKYTHNSSKHPIIFYTPVLMVHLFSSSNDFNILFTAHFTHPYNII